MRSWGGGRAQACGSTKAPLLDDHTSDSRVHGNEHGRSLASCPPLNRSWMQPSSSTFCMLGSVCSKGEAK